MPKSSTNVPVASGKPRHASSWRFGGEKRHEIVGVVGDTRYRDIEQPADPAFYLPLEQNDERWPFLSIQLWADEVKPAGLSALASAIRRGVRAADPAQPITRIRTYDELLSGAMAGRRFNTLLVGLFAATALLLAAIGTYGVMAYGVAIRTRELGVRAALGASPASLRWMVLGEGAWLSGLAVALGLAAAWVATRFVASLLFGVAPADVGTYGVVGVLLLAVGTLASWLPARSATRVEPITALRDA
jgi:predicted lysophospholipase L1 biosynthesis ABC-type transport system permease subunit